MLDFYPIKMETANGPLNIDLRNDVTRRFNVEGAKILHDENPGVTVVRYPNDGRDIAALWFNDPSDKGLFTLEALQQFESQLRELATNDEISGLVFTDNMPEEGKVSFFGINVDQVFGPIFEGVSRGEREEMENLLRIGQRISESIYMYPKPVVGAMRRLAVGGGFEFMIPTHHIVQGPRAAYSLPECQLDVPAFVRERYGHDLDLGNPDYQSGSVLFPGWIGNVLLYNKLIAAGTAPEDATQIVDDFTFNGTALKADEARQLGVADAYVAEDAQMIDAAAEFIHRDFTPRPNNLLSLPAHLPATHENYNTLGKHAGALLLYQHELDAEPYDRIGERALQLMMNAMHYGLRVEGPLPYREYARRFSGDAFFAPGEQQTSTGI